MMASRENLPRKKTTSVDDVFPLKADFVQRYDALAVKFSGFVSAL